jgi:hypothetical protein
MAGRALRNARHTDARAAGGPKAIQTSGISQQGACRKLTILKNTDIYQYLRSFST